MDYIKGDSVLKDELILSTYMESFACILFLQCYLICCTQTHYFSLLGTHAPQKKCTHNHLPKYTRLSLCLLFVKSMVTHTTNDWKEGETGNEVTFGCIF